MISIALPKGRLGKKAYSILKECGYTVGELADESRKLVFENEESGVRYFLVKPSDVAIYVEYGAADIGVVGKDVLIESGADVYELADLGIGKCRMCVAAREGYVEDTGRATVVATKFPRVARDYFMATNREIEVIKLYGSIELAYSQRKQTQSHGGDIPRQRTPYRKQGGVQVQGRGDKTHSRQDERGDCKMRIYDFAGLKEEDFLNRRIDDYAEYEGAVKEIVAKVRAEGDAALRYYAEKFDGGAPAGFELSREDRDAALARVSADYKAVLERSAANIREFHEMQKREGFRYTRPDGTVLGQKVTPIERVGIYVPGGTASYPSTVLMNAIPAKVAGVKELCMITPPAKGGGVRDEIVAAAEIAGVDRIFLAGGAGAIAALAYGTESIPKVDKITGSAPSASTWWRDRARSSSSRTRLRTPRPLPPTCFRRRNTTNSRARCWSQHLALLQRACPKRSKDSFGCCPERRSRGRRWKTAARSSSRTASTTR